MKASIIIALDSSENFTRNFLYFLSKYKTINDYEIIIASDGNNDINSIKFYISFSIIRINTIHSSILRYRKTLILPRIYHD